MRMRIAPPMSAPATTKMSRSSVWSRRRASSDEDHGRREDAEGDEEPVGVDGQVEAEQVTESRVHPGRPPSVVDLVPLVQGQVISAQTPMTMPISRTT